MCTSSAQVPRRKSSVVVEEMIDEAEEVAAHGNKQVALPLAPPQTAGILKHQPHF